MTMRRRLERQIVLGGIAAAVSATALADNPAETINVDANANRHAISPLIYGANWADPSALSDLNLTVNRRGGIRFYLMDNEHGVWPSNHRPIVPVGPTMDSIRDRIIAYAGMVKEVDPAALVVGPEEWGWPNYFNSPYDTQVSGGTDRANHGGMDYLPWLLQALKANNDSTGKRLLDVFSLHYYPQYSEFDQGDSSTAAQLKRNECTRDLWDPNYFSTSWISNRVKLIPRMKDWVNTYYPGTKIAITEYSWGAESHISGAIAEADVLGDRIAAGYLLANPGTQSYPAQLQMILGSGYTVGNYGDSRRTLLKASGYSHWDLSAYTNSLNSSPDTVVTMFGTNDTKEWNWSPATSASAYHDLIAQYQPLAAYPKAYICLSLPVYTPNSFGTTFVQNTLLPAIRTVATSTGVALIDNNTPLLSHSELFTGGVHPASGVITWPDHPCLSEPGPPTPAVKIYHSI